MRYLAGHVVLSLQLNSFSAVAISSLLWFCECQLAPKSTARLESTLLFPETILSFARDQLLV